MVRSSNAALGGCQVAYTVVSHLTHTTSQKRLHMMMDRPMTILGSGFRSRPSDVCGLEITPSQLQELVGTPYDVEQKEGRTILRGLDYALQLTGFDDGVMTWASESFVPIPTGEPVVPHGAKLIDQIEGSRHILGLFDDGRS